MNTDMVKVTRGRLGGPMPEPMKFSMEKSQHHRVVHVDGVFGGPTPTGFVHMAVFSQRLPLPKATYHELQDDGRLGPEITEKRESREGVFREVEVSLMMSASEALSIATWLKDKAEEVIRQTRTADTQVREDQVS